MSSVSSLNSLLASSSSTSGSSLDLSSLLSAATGASSTGIDVNAAVQAAVYAARAPERQWQAEQSTIQSQITALTSVQTATAGLASDLQALSSVTGPLASRTVSSSDPGTVSATAANGSAVGTHTVSVSKLATTASWYSPVLASSNASLGSSSLSITSASGKQANFDLTASGDNTLSGLVAAINSAGLGVTATTVQDTAGVRLAIVSQQTGAAADFTVTDTSASEPAWSSASVQSAASTLPASTFQVGVASQSANIAVPAGSTLAQVASQINNAGLNVTATVDTDSQGSHLTLTSTTGEDVQVSSDPVLTFTQASAAQDATLSVDGVPVTSASNTVTGALPGLTLNLTGATTGSPVTLTTSTDTSQINTSVAQFVSDYNALVTSVSGQFTFNASTGSQGVLGGDATIRSLQSTLLQSVGYSSTGNAGGISSLASLGIDMQDDGSLTLNTATLDQAVTTNAAGVQSFFQGNGQTGFAASMQTQLKAFSEPGVGSLTTEINNLTQQYTDLQSEVNQYESGYIASQQTLLTSMYSKAEIALQSLPNTLKQISAELNGNSNNS